MKNKLIFLLTVILLMTFNVQFVFAENKKTQEADKKTEQNIDSEKKKETVQETKKKDGISADSPVAILVDMNTGMELYRKNGDERIYPTDLTKIMTAVLVLENCKMEELVTASETALSNVKTGSSILGIVKNEKLSVRQLLYALMLGSAEDATNVLAEKTSGSIERFVSLMNDKAAALGMKNTNFTNPSGEHDERHYTTAQDMAKLAVYAMKNEDFREIVKCDSYSIPATEKSNSSRKITNRNHFVSNLLRNDYYYEYATGMKSGYSLEAKSCLAASAEKNGISLIALVFKAETKDDVAQSFSDCKKMFDFVFENYEAQRIVNKDDIIAQTEVINTRRNNKLLLKAGSGLSVLKKKNEKKLEIKFEDTIPAQLSAPIKGKQQVGKREFFLNGKSIGKIDLLADKDYALDPISFIVNKMIAFATSPWLFAAVVALVTILILMERRRRRILRKKRRDARRKRNKEMLERIELNL